MKKGRFVALLLIVQILMGLMYVPAFAATATPEFFAYRILSRSTVLQADNAIAYAFNERADLSATKPYFEGDTAMVPVRFLAESFNTEYSWESAKGGTFVVEQRNCAVIRITAGKPITADGVAIDSAALPVNKNGTLYVPADAFAKAMRIEYKENKEYGLMFFSRWDESVRHSKVDYKEHLLPYFEKKYLENEETYLYVSPKGNDKNDGTIDKPFKTIERAQKAVRELTENQKGDIVVYFRGGTYPVSKTVVFTETDSGRNGYKVRYTAYEDEKPIFDGAKQVTGWDIYAGNIYVADVKGEKPIHMVYENGNTTLKARHPNANPKEPRDGFMKTTGGNGDVKLSLSWNKGEVPYVKNTEGLEVFVWPGGPSGIWMWHSQLIPVVKFDNANSILQLERTGIYDFGAGSKFYMMGAMEFLDAPGEFYHDTKAGKLYYIPNDYSMSGKRISIPMVDDVFSLKGASLTETVQNIEFSGLEIRNTKRSTNVAYCASVFVDATTGNGFKFENAENCAVIDCHIHDVGGNGIFAAGFNSNLQIDCNYVHSAGLGAIYFNIEEVFQSANNVISNNLVHTTSRLVGQTQAIQISGGSDNFIRHNRVDDAIRTGIQMSGRTGFNYVGYNDLSDCNASAEDTGMMYFSNTMEGTGSTVHNNFMHDSNAGYSHWSAYYSDIVCDSMRCQNNIVTRMATEGPDDRGTYINSYFAKGRDFKFINNIAAHAGVDPTQGSYHLYDSTGTKSEGYIIEHNISYEHGPNPYDAPHLTEKTVARADNNLYYDSDATEYTLTHTPVATFEEWKKYGAGTYDQNSLTEDPKFMNSLADDFRLRYDSPAKTIGIKTIKQSTIGLNKDFQYVNDEPIWRLFINREGYTDTLSAMNLTSGQQVNLNVIGKTYSSFVKKPENITFTSDAPEIAYVDANGVVTAVSAGKAKITATVEDKGQTSSIDIYAFVDDKLVELGFDQKFYIFKTGELNSVMPIGKTQFGQILVGEEFEDIKFSLQNPETAYLDAGGNVRFDQEAANELTATVTLNGESISATVPVSGVNAYINNVKLKIASNVVEEGAELACQVMGYSEGGEEIPVDDFAITFTSLDETKAQFVGQNASCANIKGIASGKVPVKVTVNWLGKELSTSTNMMVTAPSKFKNDWKVSNYLGSAGYAVEDDTGISIFSSGEDIYYKEDEFTFVSREVSGDMTIEATVRDVEAAPTSIAGTGIMFRQEDTAGAYNVNIRYIPSNKGVIMTWRSPDFPNSTDTSVSREISKEFVYHDPVKLKLEKKGDIIVASCMDGNGTWHVVKEVNVPITGTYMAGATSFSGDPENVQWFHSRVEDVKIY
ncbi:MAG: Ig-like domain-containing protein [Clostridia bacterium]|nr:Ig-like domain-containing protein [Clostridia bacterium]